ncbi:MAG: response regulator [Prevotella sp.]|nr:response regulator [Prevotella sp.]
MTNRRVFDRVVLLALMLWVSTCVHAVSRFYDADLLSSDVITSLCQDRQGYVWIGTEYGLNRFDGVRFRQYYNDDSNAQSLLDDIVRCMLVDGQGRLWVVSNLGVQRYNRMTDAFDTVLFGDDRMANVNDIVETADGHIWLLSAEHGVFEVDNELRAQPVAAVNKHIDRHVKANNMFLDSKGRLWIGYQDATLQVIDSKSGKAWNYTDQLQPDNRAVDVTEDAKHRLLVLTYSSVMQLNEKTRGLETVVSYPRNEMTHFFHADKGQLLAGTSGSGLWVVDVDGHEVRRVADMPTDAVDMNTAKVHAFLADQGGNRWVGCYQRGLLFNSRQTYPFHFIPLSQLPTNNGRVLRSLFADEHKNVYVCQEQGGIAVNSPAGQTLHHWLPGYTVMAVHKDRQGMVWAGTYRDGLFRIDPQNGQSVQLPQTVHQRIGSITQDKQGNLYTAVFSDGLHSYTPDGKTERVLGRGQLKLHNLYLNKLFTDRDGKIWIGHYYGIDVYDPQSDRLIDVHVPDALRPTIVYSIEQSPDGSIWVGSNRGLFQYYTQDEKNGNGRKGQWKRFTIKDGLPNDIICGIVITLGGTLWVSTYRGLAEIKTDGSFTRYYRGNGLEEWSYLRGVYAWTGIGEVVLGNQYGITYFNPDKIAKNEFRSGILLTGMRMGTVTVNAATETNGKHIITKPLDESDDITVSYQDNTFSLQFATMDFRDPQNVHYEFRFEGESDDQWYQTESGRSELFFSHLAVGNHKLLVRAYDNGVYSPVKTIMLRVSPPWYRTPGAYAFYLIILLSMLLLVWRNWKNRQQAETNEEKIRFFVDISHELRSPLTLIKSPLEQLLKNLHDPGQVRALRNIERNTNRLLTLTNQILSIRKIEKGQMQLHFAETRLGDFVGDIVNDFIYQTEKRQQTLTFNNEAQDLKVWIDRDNFDKVVSNLLNNAIKYVPDGGEISVTLRQTADNHAELKVTDNGPGIDEAQLRKVFERFYQASVRPASGQMSYGIGLNLTQKLIALHKGTIVASNRIDGHGAEFVVRLPLGSMHLPQDQLVDGDYFASAPVDEQRQSIATDADRPRRVRKKTSYRVAVVDDDEEMRVFLQTELGESYHVQTYPDGQKALEGIVDTVPDLVVSDVVMPRMDGFELLKRLKASTTTSHIPVILLTSKNEHQSRVEGLESGADAYVDKPFNLEELEAQISGLIANRLRMKGKFTGVQEQENTVRQVELKGNDAALMERIMKAVNERLDDDTFNVEALADEVGLSRVQLHRRMKELTGITVGEFIRNLRLQQAAKLLASGDVTVSQVTYAVGFSTPTHFATAFKKHYGVTPSEYISKANGKREQNETKTNEDETIS